jgi:multidrug efflux pump subunit AcrA (membrane-fusion protein)
MKRKRILALILIASAIITSGCTPLKEVIKGGKEDAEEKVKKVAVEVETLEKTNFKREVMYSERLLPKDKVTVIPKVTGNILDVYFDIGDTVEKDDILLKTDDEDLRDNLKDLKLQLENINTAIKMQEINLSSMKTSQYEQQIMQLEQQMESARLSMESTLLVYNDTRKLYDNNSASKTQLNQAETAYLQAKLMYDTAKDSYDLYKDELSKTGIETAELQLKQSKLSKEQLLLAINNLEEMIADTELKAPVSGIISMRNAEVNSMLSPQMPPFTIINTEEMLINTGISEELAGKIKKDAKVSIKVQDMDIEGTVYAISPAIDDRTGKYQIKIRINNSDNKLKAGMFAEISFTLELMKDIISVPINTVKKEGENEFVYTVKDNKAVKTTVKTGEYNGENIIIKEGLKSGDILVIKGQEFLEDGTELEIID